jgi:hypothetical protein
MDVRPTPELLLPGQTLLGSCKVLWHADMLSHFFASQQFGWRKRTNLRENIHTPKVWIMSFIPVSKCYYISWFSPSFCILIPCHYAYFIPEWIWIYYLLFGRTLLRFSIRKLGILTKILVIFQSLQARGGIIDSPQYKNVGSCIPCGILGSDGYVGEDSRILGFGRLVNSYRCVGGTCCAILHGLQLFINRYVATFKKTWIVGFILYHSQFIAKSYNYFDPLSW